MSESNNVSNGVGFHGLLALIFITLKLLGIITWSWWWVISPLWIVPILITLIIICILIILMFTNKPIEALNSEVSTFK